MIKNFDKFRDEFQIINNRRSYKKPFQFYLMKF